MFVHISVIFREFFSYLTNTVYTHIFNNIILVHNCIFLAYLCIFVHILCIYIHIFIQSIYLNTFAYFLHFFHQKPSFSGIFLHISAGSIPASPVPALQQKIRVFLATCRFARIWQTLSAARPAGSRPAHPTGVPAGLPRCSTSPSDSTSATAAAPLRRAAPLSEPNSPIILKQPRPKVSECARS